jgi:hypothetical protein
MDRDLVKGWTAAIIRVKGTITVNGFGIQLVLLVTEGQHENAGKKDKGAGAGKERHDIFIVAQEVRDPPYHPIPSFFCMMRTKIYVERTDTAAKVKSASASL